MLYKTNTTTTNKHTEKKRYFKINSRNPNFFQIKFFVVDFTVIDHVPFTKQNIAPVTYSFNLRFKFIAIRYP